MGLKIENGVSSTQMVEYAILSSRLGTVLDLKFIDDDFIMLVVSEKGKIMCATVFMSAR